MENGFAIILMDNQQNPYSSGKKTEKIEGMI